MGKRLTLEQKMKMLDTVLMDDYKYDAQYIGQLSEEEYQRFLKLCPKFEEESEWAKERKREV